MEKMKTLFLPSWRRVFPPPLTPRWESHKFSYFSKLWLPGGQSWKPKVHHLVPSQEDWHCLELWEVPDWAWWDSFQEIFQVNTFFIHHYHFHHLKHFQIFPHLWYRRGYQAPTWWPIIPVSKDHLAPEWSKHHNWLSCPGGCWWYVCNGSYYTEIHCTNWNRVTFSSWRLEKFSGI